MWRERDQWRGFLLCADHMRNDAYGPLLQLPEAILEVRQERPGAALLFRFQGLWQLANQPTSQGSLGLPASGRGALPPFPGGRPAQGCGQLGSLPFAMVQTDRRERPLCEDQKVLTKLALAWLLPRPSNTCPAACGR